MDKPESRGWQYQYAAVTTSSPKQHPQDEGEINDHLTKMANAGWELLSATAVKTGSFTTHHFYWKKPR